MQPGFSRKSTATKPASHCFTTGCQRRRASVQLSDRRGKKPEKPSWHCPFELSSLQPSACSYMLQEQQPVRKWAHVDPAMCLMDSGLLRIPSCQLWSQAHLGEHRHPTCFKFRSLAIPLATLVTYPGSVHFDVDYLQVQAPVLAKPH